LQLQCMCMAKKSFTTRLDTDVLAVAQKLADVERRSVTSMIEMAIIEYAKNRGIDASLLAINLAAKENAQ
jgi:hypothetical protein